MSVFDGDSGADRLAVYIDRRERLMRALQAQHAEAAPLLGATEPAAPPAPARPADQPLAGEEPTEAFAPFVRSDRKVGRNELCPCGSGKKYKHCHGRHA